MGNLDKLAVCVCVCVCEMFEVCQFMFCSETGLQCVVCLYFLMIDVC